MPPNAHVIKRVLSDEELRHAVRLRPEEVQPFRELFQTAAGGCGSKQLHGKLAVAFFSRSGLPHSTLKEVWEVSDREGKGHLTRSEFVLAARLVALAQVGMRPTIEQLLAWKQQLPTPKFEVPDNIYTDDFDVTEAERAIKLEYDVSTAKWRRTLVNVVIERQAFAEGAMRAAYHMRDLSASGEESRYVAKISKVAGTPPSQYFDDVRMQSEAQKWARDFNSRGVPKAVEFIGAYVMELVDREIRPICGVERYVPGQYVKYNNNWDWSDDRRNTPQAFSHFTWEASNHQLLICDIQGVADMYTDPQIHSISSQGYGQGNLGMRGITKFLESHTCNHICRFLQLPHKAGKFRNEGTVVSGALERHPANKDVGTNINSKAMVPARMEEVVQNLQLQWKQELMGLQQQAHNIVQVKLEAERRKMQQQQVVERKEQHRLLEIERNRLEEEKLRWLDAEKKKLGEQMERRLEQERRRLEHQALRQFVAAEGPLDRPALGATILQAASACVQKQAAGASGALVASIGEAPAGNFAQGEEEQQPVGNGDWSTSDGVWADLHGIPQHWVAFTNDEESHLNQSSGASSQEDVQRLPAQQPDQKCGVRGEMQGKAFVLQRPFGAWNGTFVASPAPHGAALEGCSHRAALEGCSSNHGLVAYDPPPAHAASPAAVPEAPAPLPAAGGGHRRNLSSIEDLLLKGISQELDSMQVCGNGVSSRLSARGGGDGNSGELASLDGLVSQKVQRMLSENANNKR